MFILEITIDEWPGNAIAENSEDESGHAARIIICRAQDHLRQMGPGREGILSIMDYVKDTHGENYSISEATDDQHPHQLKSQWPTDITEDNINRFREIFQECSQQFKEKCQKRTEPLHTDRAL